MHSVFFFSVGEFWDSFGQRGQGLEPLEDHIAKLGLQFKTVEAVRRTCLHLDLVSAEIEEKATLCFSASS